MIFNDNIARPYTYIITYKLTGEFYYGSRKENVKFKRPAVQDLGIFYKTSSKKIKEIGIENFTYTVMDEYDTYDEAYEAEQRVIKINFDNPLILNRFFIDIDNGYKHFKHDKEQSEEAIQIIRNKRALQLISEETKQKMRNSHQKRLVTKNKEIKPRRPIKRIASCKPLSEKHKRNISLGSPRLSGKDNPMYDHRVFCWYNVDGRTETCTKWELYTKYSLNKSNVQAVSVGREKSIKGWKIKS